MVALAQQRQSMTLAEKMPTENVGRWYLTAMGMVEGNRGGGDRLDEIRPCCSTEHFAVPAIITIYS
jgi:hypothetical protein